MKGLDSFKNGIDQINLVNIKDLKYIFFEVKEKVPKNYVKAGIVKMKTKKYLVLFSNALLILKLMLCNRNLTKLVYQTLLIAEHEL